MAMPMPPVPKTLPFISKVGAAAEKAIIHHYMDDVLVCTSDEDLLAHALDLTVAALVAVGFELQESKIPQMSRWKYLGLEIGGKSWNAIVHLVQAFSFMGIPKALKTDNRPAYKSKEFRDFLQQWGVEHKTGIPHSLTGQAIVERTHRDLKRVLSQQQSVLQRAQLPCRNTDFSYISESGFKSGCKKKKDMITLEEQEGQKNEKTPAQPEKLYKNGSYEGRIGELKEVQGDRD
ncbi:hypothetical protein HGM15179_019732 [Zosterops borbonicus]|uniref:ribonuclease H n=1 Tax=Zosterops borbonicus TaxID=364589 RepID=A0A8K1FVN3_9PASS|nr:hypothetical protein HGM15179_019732 [Zosterops borbonicus]